MKAWNGGSGVLCFLLGVVPVALSQSASDPARQAHDASLQAYVASQQNGFASWLDGRLEIGARIQYYNLQDSRRPGPDGLNNNNLQVNYIGSVWGLEEIQDYVPRFYAQYLATPYFGVGLTYDHVAAETRDWSNVEQTRTGSDGDLHVWGPMLYLFARYPNPTRFTPILEAGWVYYFADFKEDANWAAAGPGYRFKVDDTDGYYLALGLDYSVNDRWHVQAYWRRLFEAEVDARAYFYPGSRIHRSGSFPLEYNMYGLGLSYAF